MYIYPTHVHNFPIGDFYLYSVNLHGQEGVLKMCNVRSHFNQDIPDPNHTMHVAMGWTAMKRSHTPIACLEFHGSGRIQFVYIRSVEHLSETDHHDLFFYEFRNLQASFTTPKVKSVTDGLGYEVIVHFCRDGQEFLRILDCSGYLDTEFNWIGDIPLTLPCQNVTTPYRAYRTTIALGYSEIAMSDISQPKRYKGSYLISRFNPHRDTYEHLELAKVYYTDPKERPNRSIPENFQVKRSAFVYDRYVTPDEKKNEWRCLRIFPIESSNHRSLLPKNMVVMKIQYTPGQGIKYKISLKQLPLALKHIDYDDPYPEHSIEYQMEPHA